MRKWTVSLTCLGLGGLSALLLTRSRRGAPCVAGEAEPISWDAAARQELQGIQQAVRQLEQSLPSSHSQTR